MSNGFCKCGNHGPEQYNVPERSEYCFSCWVARWHPNKMPNIQQPPEPKEIPADTGWTPSAEQIEAFPALKDFGKIGAAKLDLIPVKKKHCGACGKRPPLRIIR